MMRMIVLSTCLVVTWSAAEAAEPAGKVLPEEARARAVAMIDKALSYLAASQQADGSWQMMGHGEPAVTALVAKCFIQSPKYGPRHAVVDKAVKFVMRFRHDDGGIYVEGAGLRNYQTSVALMMLSSLPKGDPAVAKTIAGAQEFLKALQWDADQTDSEGEKVTEAHRFYGGAGYGKRQRPDLSNTQLMLEALHQSGLPKDDPAYKKALVFIERCQMNSETNDQPFARGADDGGFIYTPAATDPKDPISKAGTVEVEGRSIPRSYGSMTYAGFKSLLHADVARDDPRVQRAFDWIQTHYTLDSNPNMPGAQSQQGLFYYYHTFAKALEAWGQPTITDKKGRTHRWRVDLIDALRKRQSPDGSWVNMADRWYEGHPPLVTAYAVLALQAALR